MIDWLIYLLIDWLIDWLIRLCFTPYWQYFSHITAAHGYWIYFPGQMFLWDTFWYHTVMMTLYLTSFNGYLFKTDIIPSTTEDSCLWACFTTSYDTQVSSFRLLMTFPVFCSLHQNGTSSLSAYDIKKLAYRSWRFSNYTTVH